MRKDDGALGDTQEDRGVNRRMESGVRTNTVGEVGLVLGTSKDFESSRESGDEEPLRLVLWGEKEGREETRQCTHILWWSPFGRT